MRIPDSSNANSGNESVLFESAFSATGSFSSIVVLERPLVPQHRHTSPVGVQSQYAPPITICPPKAGKDRHSMSKDTDKNLFIVSSMPRLYQHLFKGIASFEELGNRIIKQIKAAHAFRQVEQVRELSRILINIPIKEYQLIAQYYLVWCKCREFQYRDKVLESISEQTQTYKAKALISRAAFEIYKGNMENAIYFYTEALKTNPTIPDYIKASTGIAIV